MMTSPVCATRRSSSWVRMRTAWPVAARRGVQAQGAMAAPARRGAAATDSSSSRLATGAAVSSFAGTAGVGRHLQQLGGGCGRGGRGHDLGQLDLRGIVGRAQRVEGGLQGVEARQQLLDVGPFGALGAQDFDLGLHAVRALAQAHGAGQPCAALERVQRAQRRARAARCRRGDAPTGAARRRAGAAVRPLLPRRSGTGRRRPRRPGRWRLRNRPAPRRPRRRRHLHASGRTSAAARQLRAASASWRRRAAPAACLRPDRAGSRRRTGAAGGAARRPPPPAPRPAPPCRGPASCRCCSAASNRRAMPDRPWKPTVAELPASEWASATVESAQAQVRFERPFADVGGELARPFVGLVEVDVVERDADAQRADDLDLVSALRARGRSGFDGFGRFCFCCFVGNELPALRSGGPARFVDGHERLLRQPPAAGSSGSRRSGSASATGCGSRAATGSSGSSSCSGSAAASMTSGSAATTAAACTGSGSGSQSRCGQAGAWSARWLRSIR